MSELALFCKRNRQFGVHASSPKSCLDPCVTLISVVFNFIIVCFALYLWIIFGTNNTDTISWTGRDSGQDVIIQWLHQLPNFPSVLEHRWAYSFLGEEAEGIFCFSCIDLQWGSKVHFLMHTNGEVILDFWTCLYTDCPLVEFDTKVGCAKYAHVMEG